MIAITTVVLTPKQKLFVVFKNRSQKIRLGITVTKKIGGAVSRNRAKRVLTAAFAETVGKLNVGYDFVLVARTRLLSLKSTQVAASMEKVFREAGLLNENE